MASAPEDAQPNEQDEEVLELGAEQQEEQHDEQIPPDEGEDEFVIELAGDDEQAEPESAPIRQLREQLKEERRRRAELESKITPAKVELGPKPTLESCEYDEERFGAELDAWYSKRDAAQAQERQAEQAQAQQAEKQRQIQARYAAKAETLIQRAKITPEQYRASEDAFAQEIASGDAGDAIKGLVTAYIEDAPLVIHALGSRPQVRARISAIDDPVKKFLAVYDLSKEIKVATKRKAPPPPEERISGSGRITQSDPAKELERLEAKAAKTGDRTEIIAFKRAQRMKEQAK